MTTTTAATPATTPGASAAKPAGSPAAASAAADTMRAIVQDRYGSADVLCLAHVPRPAIAADEVLVEVVAAGVDRGVVHLMTGLPWAVRLAGYGVTKPKSAVPGLDVAGRVVAVGADVTRFALGDEVFGIAKGAYAEYAAASEHKLVHKSARLSFEQAAVAAISGITALEGLADSGRLQAGQHVLVLGASGGVGTFAVQLAKAMGATVTGVASTVKLDLVTSLGADHVIDYTADDPLDGVRYDLILDIGGRNSLQRLRGALTASGTLVIVGGEGGGRWTGGAGRQLRALMLSPFVPQRLTSFMSTEHSSVIERLATHMASGAVVPVVDRTFDLEDVPTAIRELEAGRVRGKVAITVKATA